MKRINDALLMYKTTARLNSKNINLKFYLSYFGLFLLSAIWGSSFIFIKLSVDSIHPILLTSYRLIIASVILVFFL